MSIVPLIPMKTPTALLLSAIAMFATSLQAALPPEIKLWPGAVPGDAEFKKPANYKEPEAKDDTLRIGWVSDPTLSLFPVTGSAAKPVTVVVCPGGGYNILAWDKEGTEVAAWLNSLGVSAAVLKYRVPRRDKDAPHKAPLQDAQRALRLIRANAKAWGLPVEKLGMVGFSAGGNLTVMAATHFDDTTYPAQDAADALSCRPDFVMPIYPAYLGNERTVGPLSPLVTVTRNTPPVFVAVTDDDVLRGVNAASFYIELKKAHVPSELHIFAKGGHGYGLRPSANPVSQWPKRAEDWLRAMKILPE